MPVSGEANFEPSPIEETKTEGAEGYFVPAVKSAREARAAVLALPLDEDRQERAVLVVSELAGNAILHAGGSCGSRSPTTNAGPASRWLMPQKCCPGRLTWAR